ncbi:MAG TPA: HAMP domain-containing sensor histidine kinase [Candidatus Sulfomarinibacteraceae bacterium]|nr:HAMP domain-containing sensor histidine kinase [Candidatus Sulfomarinibacteraceae bacterium]
MNFQLLNWYLPLIFAAGYTILLLSLLARFSQRNQQTRWYLGFLAASIVWSVALFALPQGQSPPNLTLHLLGASATLLGTTTAVYVGWLNERRWLYLGVVAVVVAVGLETVAPNSVLVLGDGVRYRGTLGGLLGFATWFCFNSGLLLWTWRDYQETRLPWHANRLLHWAVFAFATVAGELLTFSTVSWIVAAGYLLRFVGVLGLARAITSHRLFDVRAHLRKIVAFTLIVVASAVPASIVLTLTLWLTDQLDLPLSQVYLASLVVISGGFLLYQPFRRFVERVVYRYLLGQEFQTSQVVRSYSQAISRTLEIEQLAQVIIGEIGDLLQTTHGALMLVSEVRDGYQVEAIPSGNHHGHSQIVFAGDSLFIEALNSERRPLLQYDVDFNPFYQDLDESEREWLSIQNMELFVPIHNGSELAGLIALGPKLSGLAYRPNELELVQVLAEQTVIALQNARLYSELNEQNDRIRFLNSDLRRQNERLEILDRIKSDFITIASHELRTPLTQVKGYADILTAMNEEATLSQKDTREIVSHITRASSRLEGLLTAMLDASQLEVSGMELTFMRTRLEVVIQLAIEPLSPAIRQRGLNLEMHGLGDLPPIQADFKRLVQAFHNLIGNAIKYTPDYGLVSIFANRAPSAEDEEDYIEVVIADTGIGIDPQYHELIFEKFFRIGNPELHSTGATKFKGAGPGLGLHIAKGVIEAHGGRIWVESEGEDEERLPGSRFHVIVPFTPPGYEEGPSLDSPQAKRLFNLLSEDPA